MLPRPFALSIISRKVSRGYQEKDDNHYEGGTEGNAAKAADRVVRVAGTGRGDNDSRDKGCLFGWSVVRHTRGWRVCRKVCLS